MLEARWSLQLAWEALYGPLGAFGVLAPCDGLMSWPLSMARRVASPHSMPTIA
jgi:hypothetical protein